MTIILCKKPKTKAMVGLDIVSIVFSVVSVVMFVMSGPLASQASAFNFGDMPVLPVLLQFLGDTLLLLYFY